MLATPAKRGQLYVFGLDANKPTCGSCTGLE